jgi:hypothetical protein
MHAPVTTRTRAFTGARARREAARTCGNWHEQDRDDAARLRRAREENNERQKGRAERREVEGRAGPRVRDPVGGGDDVPEERRRDDQEPSQARLLQHQVRE